MSTKKLLLLDDDENDIALFLQAVERLNLQGAVATACDGIAALDYLQPLPTSQLPRLLVVDYKMPRMDAVGFLTALRKDARFRLLPAVVLTSSSDQQDIVRAYTAGANGYLIKPISFSRFCREVELLVKFWLQLNVGPYQTRQGEAF